MSFSPSELLVRLLSKEPDLRSLELMDSTQNDVWTSRNSIINEELQDLMVDVVVIFSKLPVLLDTPAVIDKWNAAFDTLFELMRGLRPVMEMEIITPTEPFEGRHGRFYEPIEAEYFLTCFFNDFYDVLSKTKILGRFQVESAWAEPIDDLFALYKYVRENKTNLTREPQRKAKNRPSYSSQHRPTYNGITEVSTVPDKDLAFLGIKKYLENLVEAGSTTDASSRNLMDIAKAIDHLEDSSIHRYLQSFRKREFAKLYAPVQNSVNGDILVGVLAKYYLEFAADPRIFNAPTFETIVKDLTRDPKCDTDLC